MLSKTVTPPGALSGPRHPGYPSSQVMPDMKIMTNSALTKKAREGVMETIVKHVLSVHLPADVCDTCG